MLRRIVLIGVLVAALFGLAVWYGSVSGSPETGVFPTAADLGADYDGHVGDRVLVTGRVAETDPVVLVASSPSGDLSFRIVGLERPVSEGDRIQVFGVAEPGNEIRSINAVDAGGRAYAWSISFLAGLWVLARIVSYWRLDRETWSVRPDGGEFPDA